MRHQASSPPCLQCLQAALPEAATKGITLKALRALDERVRQLCLEGRFAEDRDIDGVEVKGTMDYHELLTAQLVYM